MHDALTEAGFIEELDNEVNPQAHLNIDSMKGKEANKGGEEMDFFNLDLYKNDTDDYSGKTNIVKMLLRQTIVNPFFGDKLR